jgi:sugar lactone lactonase YvrE
VVPAGETVRKLADGFKFTEGPAWSRSGRIYFSDIPNERIHIHDPATGETTIHRESSGRANGLMFTPSGALLACEGGNRRLTRQFGETIAVLAERFEGKRLNSPNDLVMDGQGGTYFTDPRYGKRDDMEMDVEGVYAIDLEVAGALP